MSASKAEMIVEQIVQLPPSERAKVLRMLEARETPIAEQKLRPIPIPDSTRETTWIAEHKREYAGQWVALDGDRLIAHGKHHDEVWTAAKADGAYLPLCTFIEDPDAPPFVGI